jgi:hypothetical protein
VAVGQIADLVVVDGNPADDITATQQIEEVIQAGRRLDRSQLTSAQPAGVLVPQAVALDDGAFCVQDADCTTGFACDEFSWQCTRGCNAADPSTCPQGFACFQLSLTRSLCYPSEGCDPLAQDCPFATTYKTTCTPYESDYTYCAYSGPKLEGDPCDPYALAGGDTSCAQGLYCGQGNQCYALCDPSQPAGSEALPACTGTHSCMDLSSGWGYAVGLCL